jgi:hypothetical protein
MEKERQRWSVHSDRPSTNVPGFFPKLCGPLIATAIAKKNAANSLNSFPAGPAKNEQPDAKRLKRSDKHEFDPQMPNTALKAFNFQTTANKTAVDGKSKQES